MPANETDTTKTDTVNTTNTAPDTPAGNPPISTDTPARPRARRKPSTTARRPRNATRASAAAAPPDPATTTPGNGPHTTAPDSDTNQGDTDTGDTDQGKTHHGHSGAGDPDRPTTVPDPVTSTNTTDSATEGTTEDALAVVRPRTTATPPQPASDTTASDTTASDITESGSTIEPDTPESGGESGPVESRTVESEQGEPAAVESVAEPTATDPAVPGTGSAVPVEPTNPKPQKSPQRLARGQLRDLVLQMLADSPTREFTASQVSNALRRSSGAVGNALERLQKAGPIIRVKDTPRTYRYSTHQPTP